MGNGCSSSTTARRIVSEPSPQTPSDSFTKAAESSFRTPHRTARGEEEQPKTAADIAYESARDGVSDRYCLTTDDEKAYRRKWRCYTSLFGTLDEEDVLFPWNDEYELGVSMIDRQHFKLVALINELHYAETKAREDRWIIGYVIDALVQYTDYHFSEEERMLEVFKFCDAEELNVHKQKHRDFVKKISEFKDSYQNVEQMSVGEQILNFLKAWLSGHILNSDRTICNFVIKEIKKEQGLEDETPGNEEPETEKEQKGEENTANKESGGKEGDEKDGKDQTDDKENEGEWTHPDIMRPIGEVIEKKEQPGERNDEDK